jgi:hypothetical protein
MGARLIKNSDAWAGAWGITWGNSWGSSWGPLHEVEESPGQVYGNGRKSQVTGPDPLRDGPTIVQSDSEEEFIRHKVYEKWEAIEAAQARDAATPEVAIATPDVVAVEADSADEQNDAISLASVAPIAIKTIAKPGDWPKLASVPVSQDLTWAVLYQRQREEAAQVTAMAKARRQADEEALMLVLAEVI